MQNKMEKIIKSIKNIRIIKIGQKIVLAVVSILVILLSGVGIVLFNASRWVMDTWGLITFDEIIFHLKVPMEGTKYRYDF